ncbi:hypothetical protein CGRA01v4_05068 [Colletotrichum graminicola]|nr:hypothetical protein CGRA01v4_05068 [Colletotrichum graminicola]
MRATCPPDNIVSGLLTGCHSGTSGLLNLAVTGSHPSVMFPSSGRGPFFISHAASTIRSQMAAVQQRRWPAYASVLSRHFTYRSVALVGFDGPEGLRLDEQWPG